MSAQLTLVLVSFQRLCSGTVGRRYNKPMPPLAYTQSGEPLVAPLMSDDEWEQLKSERDRDAWMPGSRRRAIPKVSRLGTRFFAHPPGHAAAGSRESDLHLYIKAQCLIGARAAG